MRERRSAPRGGESPAVQRVPSLELFYGSGSEAVFSSAASWLHPLFELERFFADSGVNPRECLLRDKLVGKAAALLIVRLGLVRVHTGILSRPGEAVFLAHRVQYRAEEQVERILCRTEEFLADVEDPMEAYRLIRRQMEERGVES